MTEIILYYALICYITAGFMTMSTVMGIFHGKGEPAPTLVLLIAFFVWWLPMEIKK